MEYLNKENIKEKDIYVGNIYLVCGYSNSVLAKSDAVLIKVNDIYIDIDCIKSNNDIEIINRLLESNPYDNNLILNEINRGYIGSLYVDDIKCIKKSDELKLRLKNIHE